MQRRLNLAMALVHDPQIVILDEPEAGLDPQSRVLVREYIRTLASQKTVILTTHNMDEADRLADRVAIIDRGRLLVLDTPLALKARLGEGDVLEIGLGKGEFNFDPVRVELAGLSGQIEVRTSNGFLTLRARNIVQILPQILELLETHHIPLAEIRLRETTLEDVFIQLTGRKLRD
jgi:ABC-2 type transport system ATP-binding protein